MTSKGGVNEPVAHHNPIPLTTELICSLLYPPYPKDPGMLWFYVEAARRSPPAMVLTR